MTQDARGRWFDVLVALAFMLLSAFLALGLVEAPGERAVALVLGAAHCGPLAWRRRFPLGVLAAMAATAALSVPLGVPVVALGPAVVVAAYSVGAHVEMRRAQVAGGVSMVVMAFVVMGNGADVGTVASNSIVIAAALWLGARARRVQHEAYLEKLEAVQRASLDERLRIARELHDVVAHSMTVIAVQAGAARLAAESSETESALRSIETTSRSALDEMRRLVAVLRDGDAPFGLAPAPGIEDVEGLIANAAATGLDVRADVRAPEALPAGLALCAYRVVQEALTNVCKHAHARHAEVRVGASDGFLEVEISDDGNGSLARSATRPGHGLDGMRERVNLYGGSIEAGPLPGGGFRVEARLPLGAGS